MKNNTNIAKFSLKDLFQSGQYRIPIYQRNYDWGEKEVCQLLEDLTDFATNYENNNYYLGSLVVVTKSEAGNEYYETIDGQQRLTTLNILMCGLKSIMQEYGDDCMDWFQQCNVSFEHRNESDETLYNLANGIVINGNNIANVYNILEKRIRNTKSKDELADFINYILRHVFILRIPLPQDTNLNHYFEIMNSRGEQLEQHEVLKANLMESIQPFEQDLFNQIWEACSEMDKYVQMGLNPSLRNIVFGKDGNDFTKSNFDDLCRQTFQMPVSSENSEREYETYSVSQLIETANKNYKFPNPYDEENTNNNNDERFSSVINFTNFLLHVLKIEYREERSFDAETYNSIVLDDKRLLEIFSHILNKMPDKAAFAKRFILKLLHLRFLFDCYVIKRDSLTGFDNWSIKRLKIYTGNNHSIGYVNTFGKNDEEEDDESGKDICMLQAMFHVSAPTQIYKYWLHAILYQLNTKQMTSNELRTYLFRLAQTYMTDHYLSATPRDFLDIIGNTQPLQLNDIEWENLNQGCKVENFIFNYYDYIVWKSGKYPRFTFTYRTSVEHFYPQHPMENNPIMDGEYLNNFGNLCLISRSMNSRFGNNMPMAKLADFGNLAESLQLSIKLQEMMQILKNKGIWSEAEIATFSTKAKELLNQSFNE